MPHIVSADIPIDLILTVAAEIESPDKSVGEVGPQIFPDRIEGLRYDHVTRYPVIDDSGCQVGVGSEVTSTTDLLDGVNPRSPDIRKLFANLIALYSDEAEDAIREQL